MRVAFFLIRILLIFGVLRYAIGFVMKLVSGAMRPTQFAGQRTPERSQRQTAAMPGHELRKDPVCGTFIPIGSSLHKTVNGETLYFCSANCRDRFKAA